MDKAKVSIVIRTFNEAGMLDRCLYALNMQDYTNFEIIVVDSHSTDNTAEVAKKHGAKVVQLDNFTYGRGINAGIEKSDGEFIAILSGHCIPTSSNWLRRMLMAFEEEKNVAGVYGRQFPVSCSPVVSRDMMMLYGPEKRVQIKDPSFNNANSMIRRDIWEKVKFDEKLSGLEDRDWAIKVIGMGYVLVYEPNAAVHHFQEEDLDKIHRRCTRETEVLKNGLKE